MNTTPAISPPSLLFKGDPRLKRVDVSISTKSHPESKLAGYALVSELNDQMLSFFSTHKFKTDESLSVHMLVNSEDLDFQVRMSHMNEQISSGRIMTAIPTEEHPFPALKFYRCFAQILELRRNGKIDGEEPSLQAVPDLAEAQIKDEPSAEPELKVA